MVLAQKPFRTAAQQKAYDSTWIGWYKRAVRKNSFIYVGLPFFSILLMGTYMLTQFSSVRYEQRDRKHTEVSQDEQLSISGRKRQVDIKEEYYRLQQLDIDNWEQKRVKRLPGESDNKW